ncbi:MAG: epoxyqueuosine reductase, partial [Anaerolineae bacterium]|nr:epoxyqueuosine reductase [Anaerolineae bacterium]
TRCIDACPTGALVAPGIIDARRCLAYLTIEQRGPLLEALRPMIGTQVFGCDICQEVCPWNRKPQAAYATSVPPQQATLDLTELLTITPEVFRTRFRKRPIWRATPEGIARNAAIVMGNRGDEIARPYLERAIEKTNSPLVREHARWALRKIIDNVK